jgi:KDO2-lipid IV(A) lauroyltransferase
MSGDVTEATRTGRLDREGSIPLRDHIVYGGFVALRASLSFLPTKWALGLGEALGWLAGVVLRIRRNVVDENLTRAFPDESADWRRRVAVACYRHLGRESVAIFRMAGRSAAEIRAMTEVDGLDELSAVLETGQGVVVMTGHIGNWEMGSAGVAARGVPIDVVVHGQRNRRFGDDLIETRGRLGVTVIHRDVAPRHVLKSLRRGRMVVLAADQNVTGSGIFIDFFGVPASTARGPAVFTLRAGVPLWFAAVVCTSDAQPRYRIVFRPVEATLTGAMDEDVRILTEAATRQLEAFIREAPEQYFWHHRRWKTRPPVE